MSLTTRVVAQLLALQTKNQRLKAEVEKALAGWAQLASMDKEIGRKHIEELQAAKLAHEQYREWAAGQMEQMKAKLAEAESILSDNEHLDARIEQYFKAK